MGAGDYLTGFLDLTAVVGLAVVAALLAAARGAPQLRGATRAVAVGLLATLALVAAHVVPLALGVLTRGTVLAASGALALAALAVPRAPRRTAEDPAPLAPSGRLSWAMAAIAGLAVAAVSVGAAIDVAPQASTGIDMVNFHLPDVASWIQSGTLWEIYQFVPRLAHGNYPNNGDVVMLAGVLPWRSDFVVRLAMLPFLALAALAVYSLARELRAPPATAALAGTAIGAVPIVAESTVLVGLPDGVMWATFAAGLLFLVRHRRTGHGSDLVLAGAGLGLSLGTKWYGVASAAVVLVVWALGSLLEGRRPADVARRSGALVALIAATGGIWLVRNWVESGNPVFPVKVSVLGITVFDAPPDELRAREGFTVAGYAGDWDVWRHHLIPTYREFLGPVALLALLGALAAVLAARALRRRARAGEGGEEPAVLGLVVIAVLLTAVYVLLPYSAQGAQDLPVFAGPNTRYVVPALLAALPVLAWVVGRLELVRPWAGRAAEAALLMATLDGVRSAFDVRGSRPLLGLALVVGAAAAVAGWRVARERLPAPAWRAGVAATAVVGLVALGVAGRRNEVRFDEHRYRGVDATFDWLLAHRPEGGRVLLAGNWSQGVAPVLPMFGPRLRNHVAYNGPWVREMLRYHRGREPFLAALRRDGADLLVVGRGFRAAPGAPPPGDVLEERWAREGGLREAARSDTLTLFEVPGRGQAATQRPPGITP